MRLRRILSLTAVAGLLLGALIGIAARGEDDDRYLVRAVFDNASFVIPGEDVKVAGVKVGKIADVDLQPDNKAAVVLAIEDPAFLPFRSDAHCQIRLQSLIGEQFVECEPSRVRDAQAKPKRPLRKIASGRGKGQHLLPVDNTTTPVAVDLLNNIARQPQRERLRLIINEFGAGLAGNGPRLRAALRRSNPALKELDDVAKVLASQDRVLARLTDQSDRVLGPMARRRRELAGFIDHAGVVGEASAARGEDMEANFRKLPPFLRELPKTANSFGSMADQMAPALDTLGQRAPAVNAMVRRFGPFVERSTPALVTLGETAERGRRIFPAIKPMVADLRSFTRPLRPLSKDLSSLTRSFDNSGGIEDLMRFIYFYTGAVNGVDAQGHFTRTLLIASNCLERGPIPVGGCEATFDKEDQSKLARAKPKPPDTLGRDSVDADAKAYGVDLSDSKPMLDYLLGPGSADKPGAAAATPEEAP